MSASSDVFVRPGAVAAFLVLAIASTLMSAYPSASILPAVVVFGWTQIGGL